MHAGDSASRPQGECGAAPRRLLNASAVPAQKADAKEHPQETALLAPEVEHGALVGERRWTARKRHQLLCGVDPQRVKDRGA